MRHSPRLSIVVGMRKIDWRPRHQVKTQIPVSPELAAASFHPQTLVGKAEGKWFCATRQALGSEVALNGLIGHIDRLRCLVRCRGDLRRPIFSVPFGVFR